MKIVCGNCGAKYSISDDKVRGKVFKIRCKKCSEVIVVKGTEQAGGRDAPDAGSQAQRTAADDFSPQAAPAPQMSGGPEDEIWHVVVDGEQKGPFSVARLQALFSNGTIDQDAYVWRDGFGDWMALRDVEELGVVLAGGGDDAFGGHRADAGFGQGGFAESPDPFGAAPDPESPFSSASEGNNLFGGGGLFDTASSEPAEKNLFGSGSAFDEPESPAGGIDVFGSDGQDAVMSSAPVASRGRGHDMGRDLFAATRDVAEDSEGGLFASTGEESLPDPRYNASTPMMTGARNENSVLFSLSNLQALASSKASIKTASPADAKVPGLAGGDASGLIDIRTMASTIKMDKSDRAGVEDLLTIGGGAAFGGSLGAPVLAPTRSGPSKALVIGLSVGGAFLLIAITVLVVILLYKEEPKPQVAQLTPPAPQVEKAQQAVQAVTGSQAASGATGQGAATAGAADQKASGEQADSDDKESSDKDEKEDKDSAKRDRDRRKKRDSSPKDTSSGDDSSSESSRSGREETKPAKSQGGSELDDLLSGATRGSAPKGPATRNVASSSSGRSGGSSDSSLPETLSRSQVQTGMDAVKPVVERCGKGTAGTAMVNVTIAGATGSVTSALVTGQFAGTPEGTCVAQAVRRAKFPKFQRDKLTISYPFRIR